MDYRRPAAAFILNRVSAPQYCGARHSAPPTICPRSLVHFYRYCMSRLWAHLYIASILWKLDKTSMSPIKGPAPGPTHGTYIGNLEKVGRMRSNFCYLISLRHLIISGALTNEIFSPKKKLFSFIRAQHILSLPWSNHEESRKATFFIRFQRSHIKSGFGSATLNNEAASHVCLSA